MDDGEDSSRSPRRPPLDPPAVPPPDPSNEDYGRAYYSINAAQREASTPRSDRVHLPKARGGWALPLLLLAAAAYFYFNPGLIPSALETAKRWILSQQRDLFESGGGYGRLPEETGP